MNQEQIIELVKASHEAKKNSYSPYSKFRVGAALLCQDGTIFKGCNVENGLQSLNICAERTTIVKAVSEGHRQFQAIAIASDHSSSIITPCGACRQTIIEFGADLNVYMTKPDFTYKLITAGELLPLPFHHKEVEATLAQ